MGCWDGVALGEWVHAGDVREAFGSRAYCGEMLPYALTLLARVSREQHVPVHADLDDLDEPLRLGVAGDRPPARYIGDAPTLIRLYAGRPVSGTGYELALVAERDLNIFG